jgi:hypothetical protein
MVPIGPLLNSQVGLAQHRPVTPDEPGGLGHPVAGEDRAADHNRVVAAQVVDGLHWPGSACWPGACRRSAIRSAMPLVDPYLLA